MIQLNLLPEIKLEFLKAQRLKRIVILASMGITAASVAVIIVLSLVVFLWDKKSISDLTGDINVLNSKIGEVGELNKVLTIQYQLNSLKTLHDQKPVLSRIDSILLTIIPADVSLETLTIDTEMQSITMNGKSTTLERVNTLADSIKFAYYTLPDAADNKITAFKDVVVSPDIGGESGSAAFTVSLKYDPVIFERTKDVKVQLEAGKVTTRSIVEKPDPVFIKPAEEEQE